MSEFLAEATVLIRPDTTKFRAELQRELAAITAKPVVVPVRAQVAGVAATTELAAAQTQVARTATTATVATERLAGAEVTEAAAAKAAAAAEAAHARQLNAVQTAAFASGAGMLGLRGAVLTASAAFLGATVAFQATGKAIKAATDTTEELNKSFEVFGPASAQIEEFAETTASSLGIANVEALRATGIFGNLFRAIGIGQADAAEMSKTLVTLAADLASFNNADPTLVLQNLRSGLAGEAEPLRKFGIFLSEARVQQEALNATGKESVKQLTQQEKTQARFNIILRDSAIAQGDFARTQESLANQTRILKAELTDLGADIGSLLIPPLTNIAAGAADTARALKAVVDIGGRLAAPLRDTAQEGEKASGFVADFRRGLSDLLSPGKAFAITAEQIADALDKLAGNAGRADPKIQDLAHSFPAAGRAAHEAAQQIDEFRNVLLELSGLEVDQLEIQTGLTPGGRGAEEANLRAQIEADKRAVAEAQSGSKARRQALEELASDQRALEALLEKDAQELEDAADARRDAADKARRAQQDADRAFLDLLSSRIDDQERRVARASETTTLQDDIRAQNNLQALIQQQIRKIRERVKSEQARRDAIRELRIALIASRAEEERLREEQKQQAKEQAAEILDIRIQIAETKGQVALEIKLLNEKRRRLLKQIAAAKGDRLLVARLRLELAQTQKELEDLNKQQEETNKAGKTLAQSQFEFLQSLQGFSANLLGNLIPGFATGGLVGNTSASATSDIDTLRGSTQARVSQADAVRGAQDRGVRPIQVDTTNQLLRAILRTLQGEKGRMPHPEAKYQRSVGASFFDTL